MPQIIQCPSCSQQLKVPDRAAGKHVKCPRCQAAVPVPGLPAGSDPGQFTAQPPQPPPIAPGSAYSPVPQPPQGQYTPAYQQPPQQGQSAPAYQQYPQHQQQGYDQGGYPPEEEYYEEEDRPRRKRKASRSDWAKVRTGVTLVLTAILLIIGVYILFFCGIFAVTGAALGSVDPRTGNPSPALATFSGGMYALIALFIIGLITYVALTVTGNVFCINAPETAGARMLAITSVILLVTSLLFYVISILLQIFSTGLVAGGGLPMMGAGAGASMAGLVLSLLSVLTGLAQIIVFQLLLRSLAVALRRHGLASSIMAMMIVGGLAILAFVGMFFFLILGSSAAAGMGPGPGGRNTLGFTGGMGILSGCTSVLLMLTWFVWYIVSLILVRMAITEKIG